MKTAGRRPRFGDPVILRGERFIVQVRTRQQGFWIRPADAIDAARDRFLPLAEWAELRWDATSQAWELAA